MGLEGKAKRLSSSGCFCCGGGGLGLEGKAKRLSSSVFFCAGGGGLGLGGGGLLGETSTSSSDEVSNSKLSSSSEISML